MNPFFLIGGLVAGLSTGKLVYNWGKKSGKKARLKVSELVSASTNSPYFKNKEEECIDMININIVGLKNIQTMINMLKQGTETWSDYDKTQFEIYYNKLINNQLKKNNQ